MDKLLAERLRRLGVADDELHLYDLEKLAGQARGGNPEAATVATQLAETYGIPPDQLQYYTLDEHTGSLRVKNGQEQQRYARAAQKRASQEAEARRAHAENRRRGGERMRTPTPAPALAPDAGSRQLMGPDAVARGQRPAAGQGTQPMPPADEGGVFGAGQNPPGLGDSSSDSGHPMYDEHGIEGLPEGLGDGPITHEHGKYAEHQHSGDNDHTDAPLYDEDLDEAADAGAGGMPAAYSERAPAWQPPQPGSADYDAERVERAQWLAEAQYGASTQLSELPWPEAQKLYERAEKQLREEAGE